MTSKVFKYSGIYVNKIIFQYKQGSGSNLINYNPKRGDLYRPLDVFIHLNVVINNIYVLHISFTITDKFMDVGYASNYVKSRNVIVFK